MAGRGVAPRAALIPIITVVGLFFGILIGNSVLTEIVFNRPGLGKLIVGALSQRDYPMLQGILVIYTLLIVVVNVLTDMAYGLVDPRVKLRGETPKDHAIDFEQDYWLHYLLRNRSTVYKRGIAIRGDCIIEIADHAFVLTQTLGLEKIKVFSPASREGLPANPDYRIVGRGASAQIVQIHEEVDSLDFQIDPRSEEKMRHLEQEYINGRKDAVTLVRVNLSLAIRNAFDRLQRTAVASPQFWAEENRS